MNARLFALLLLALAPITARAADYSWLGAAAPEFALPKPDTPILFPQDHAAHPAFRTEWWYLTANLASDDGQSYGAQWTLFRYGLEPRDGAGSQSYLHYHADYNTGTNTIYSGGERESCLLLPVIPRGTLMAGW